MPVGPLTFRVVCGGFVTVFVNFMYKRVLVYRLSHVNTVKLCSLRLSFALVFLIATLLHRSGDVELNPGPPPMNGNTRQTRLQTNNRSLSVDNIDRTSARNEGSVQEPSLSDVMQMLSGMKQDMSQRFDTLSGHLDTMNDSVSGLRNEVTQLAREVEEMRSENEQLKAENRELTDRLGEVEKKLDDLEGRSKRNNLIFTGLQKQTQADYESWEDCEKLVQDLIHNQLKIPDDIQFDRVHRMRKDPKSPIIARFTNFKDKQRVLKQERKLSETAEGSTIFIGEDFSKGVREVRKKLVPFLKNAKADPKNNARMVYDHLVINGKRFYYDPVSNGIKEKS